uniref:NADH-ubiquinone oxidoreductase chain 2 n=1 Tax=Dicranocephalus alticolus TaxID=1589675 RepID=A0A8T9ZYB0_9HEMI|nr:NADH dehydrogenase subunit 2 [Dicranocephalus alticolus]
MNSSKILFKIILFMSTLITMSSNNWIGMWMGLEMNLMTFIPLISKNKEKNSSQAMMIYFLTQSIGSIILLFSVLMNSLLIFNPFINDITTSLLMISLFIKLGAAPFHFWLPEMMSNLKWIEASILMTWQKIAPLIILNNLNSNNTLYISIILSTLIGSIGGLNQTSLRKILAYSSINHLGWMMMFMSMNNNWYKYLMIYSSMIITLCLFLNWNNIYFINQMNSSSSSLAEKYIYVIMMLSIGGLPPFLGFLPKWMVIQSMIQSNIMLIMIIMMLFSLITLFYYLRMMSTLILNYSTSNKWNHYKSPNKTLILFILFINLMLPVFSIFNFF